jgi:hypothetical protein
LNENVIPLRPGPVGDGIKLDPDAILEANKGEFIRIALVGERADGTIAVAGTDGCAETLLLLQFGSHFIVENKVGR